MTTLDLGPSPAPPHLRRQRVNWNVVSVALTIIGWLLIAMSGVFGDYRSVNDRLTTLETQRKSDSDRIERIENKIDRLLERQR